MGLLQVNIIESFLKENAAETTETAHSNHYIGHAINIELGSVVDTGYPCKRRCLGGPVMPSYAQCFVDAVQNSLGLRWSRTDPNHVDDNFATLYPPSYNLLRIQLQTNC